MWPAIIERFPEASLFFISLPLAFIDFQGERLPLELVITYVGSLEDVLVHTHMILWSYFVLILRHLRRGMFAFNFFLGKNSKSKILYIFLTQEYSPIGINEQRQAQSILFACHKSAIIHA